MKKIHLTKKEKQLLRLFSANNPTCPDNMSNEEFIYVTIQLQDKDLISAYIALKRLKEVRLTDRGRSYMAINPSLRNPFPWDTILKIVALATLAVSFAALFVGCARLLCFL